MGSGPGPGPTKKGLVPHMTVGWGEHQIPKINNGVIRTVRDFLPFLCNSIFLLSDIRVCVFISDPFRGHNILATRNSNKKRDSPTTKRG